MSKESVFICTECGNEYSHWQGQCKYCGQWNVLKEMKPTITHSRKTSFSAGKFGAALNPSSKSLVTMQKASDIKGLKGSSRLLTGIDGVDQVLGGGIVPGEVILLAGEPGIGKSTLFLLIGELVSKTGKKVIYFAGEESVEQVGSRLKRIGREGNSDNLFISYSNDSDGIIDKIIQEKPGLVVIDSIQSVGSSGIEGGVGSISQVRDATFNFIKVAKELKIPIVLIGQITKEGSIAGPKLLEHMVDCVLYFEGDRVSDLRILRSIKNRFGKTDEIAMFKMTQSDMEEVKDLSEYFTTHQNEISGVCRGVILQGQRPIIIEVQALLNDSFFGYPRRISEGFSKNRLEVLSAILQKRLKLDLSNKDIYLNIVGGLKVKDTSVDLTVCSAILSMYRSIPIRDKVVVFGEVALSGSIGRTFNAEKRISECARFGAEKIICGNSPEDKKSKISQIMNISELEKALF